jgi:hypothetical protein
MKSTILRTLLTLSLSATFSHVALLAQDKVCATIPFDFTVGEKSLAAGKYCAHHLQPFVVQVYNAGNWSGIMAMTLPGEPSKQPGKAMFTFHRYGNSYFLAEISDDSRGRRFFKSVAEKELIARASLPQRTTATTILASK